MARGKGIFASMEIRGSIADTFTFCMWKGIQIVKRKPFPSNPNTSAQQAVRGHFSNYVAAWHNTKKTANDVLGWNLRAQKEAGAMSGFNKFGQRFGLISYGLTWILLYGAEFVLVGNQVKPHITPDCNCTITLTIVRGPGAGWSNVQAATANTDKEFPPITVNADTIMIWTAVQAGKIGETGMFRAVEMGVI